MKSADIVFQLVRLVALNRTFCFRCEQKLFCSCKIHDTTKRLRKPVTICRDNNCGVRNAFFKPPYPTLFTEFSFSIVTHPIRFTGIHLVFASGGYY